jgi:hypothetical protein
MEELRPPSPPMLSRSLTRGYQPRQPIDDDDDFLTPMDTLPNSHKMSPYGQSPPKDTAVFYSEEHAEYEQPGQGHYQQEYEEAPLPENFPVAPPAAVVAANGRYYENEYENDMSQMAPSSASNTAAIPAYSSMNKYAAFNPASASASASASNTGGYDGGGMGYDSHGNDAPAFNTRPGGGYRAYDSHDAGGYV